MTDQSAVLLISSVHPDLLPPILNIARVYSQLGYQVDVLSFGYTLSQKCKLNDGKITYHVLEKYEGSFFQKIRSQFAFGRKTFRLLDSVKELKYVFVFCPVSFFWASLSKGSNRLILHCIEIYKKPIAVSFDLIFHYYFVKNMPKSRLIFSPSKERSMDMVSRYHLNTNPGVVLNAPFQCELNYKRVKHDKIRLIHTGGMNVTRGILELLRAFKLIRHGNFELFVTNIDNSEYSKLIKDFVKMEELDNVFLLPTLDRAALIELQASADIGICFIKRTDCVDTDLIAPNKLGEYLLHGLVCIVSDQTYFKMMETHEFIKSVSINDALSVSRAIESASELVKTGHTKILIGKFLRHEYNMMHQLRSNKLI